MSGIFEKIGKKGQEKGEKSSKSSKVKSKDSIKKVATGKKNEKVVGKKGKTKKVDEFFKYIVRPNETEKASIQEAQGKYHFTVTKNANKSEVKKAIENYFGVLVEKVNIINYKPKKTRFGLQVGTKKGFKKAVVTLKEGQSIEK